MSRVLDPETARFCSIPEWEPVLFGRCGHRPELPIGRLTAETKAAMHQAAADMECEACRSAAAARVDVKRDIRKDFPDE